MKTTNIVFSALAITMLLTACNSGGGTSSTLQEPKITHTITSEWTSIGSTLDYPMNFVTNGLVYDNLSDKFFFEIKNNQTNALSICFIQRLASQTQNPDCSIQIPNGYDLDYNNDLITNNNGALYLAAYGDSKHKSGYILKYDIIHNQWLKPLAITGYFEDMSSIIIPTNLVYSNNMLIGYSIAFDGLASINLDSGQFTSESGFFEQMPLPNLQSIAGSRFYYALFKGSYTNIYSKDILNPAESAIQIGTETPTVSPKTMLTYSNNVYLCSQNNVYSINVNANTHAVWSSLPPTSIETITDKTGESKSYTTGCQGLVGLNGSLYALAAVYQPTNRQDNTSEMGYQLVKYDLK